MPLQHCKRLPCFGVPNVGHLVGRSGNGTSAIGAELGEVDMSIGVLQFRRVSPVLASQMRAVPSSDAVTIRVPSGLKAAEITQLSCCCLSLVSTSPVFAFHIRAVLSSEAVTIRSPVGSNAAKVTAPWWSLSDARSTPVLASQMPTVSSAEAVTMLAPSGLNATE